MEKPVKIDDKELQIPNDMSVIEPMFQQELESPKVAMANELFSMFMQSLPKELAEINSDYQQKDYQKLRKSVHHLHGAACYCGVPRLQRALSNLETALLQEKIGLVDDLLVVVNHEAKAVQDFANRLEMDK